MKVAIVFVLLFATVLCRPARKLSNSESSDSSEEVVRRPARPAIRKQQLALPKSRSAPVKNVVAPAKSASDESEDASDETEEAAGLPVQVKSGVAGSPADTSSVTSEDSDDSDDDHDDDKDESDTDEEDSDSQSGESSTPVPVTVTPTPGVVESETTQEPIEPTVVTDPDAGRGDSLTGLTEDYKTTVFVDKKSYQKGPDSYKSYEIVGKKVAYDMTNGNEVEKYPKVYKAFQIHSDIVEEDTSTPEVETQGLDASSGLSQDQDVKVRQAAVPAEDDSASSGASTTNDSESSSTPEEEEEEGASSLVTAPAPNPRRPEQREATATPAPADSDSDEDDSVEGDSDEDGAGPNPTDMPVVVTAK
ncbi:nucleolar and coiled-body phosphoprotein 1-like [Gambusia affinis]|uniref:nucleolar and coiled-body phosphoprotein 1-like n=1 Tax=Gambusia affinis TaxID=33528 RepID=UPI001CDC0878|nr:nucleolar and coiled-body phosphoprotein 1-like [Gambusia affinis]